MNARQFVILVSLFVKFRIDRRHVYFRFRIAYFNDVDFFVAAGGQREDCHSLSESVERSTCHSVYSL